MSLLVEAQAHAKRGSSCGMAVLQSALSESERAELQEALDASTISARALADAMKARGWVINYQTITRHRARSCSCDQ